MNAHRTPSVHQRTESTIAPPSPRPSIKLCHAQKRHYLSDQGSSDSPANHQLRKFPEVALGMCNCLTGPHGIYANCSYVKTANVDCGNKGGTIGHYYICNEWQTLQEAYRH
eukprot:7356-Heterococcus_DN1.PRE.1